MNSAYPGNTALQQAGAILGNPAVAPIREGGFQMRLLETRKMIEEGHAYLDRIENAAGTGAPKAMDNRLSQASGQMNVSQIIDELRGRTSELIQRLAMHENAF